MYWSLLSDTDRVDRMLRMLIHRSEGASREIVVSALQDDHFSFIADHARTLQVLRLPWGNMSHSTVEKVAGRLSTVTFFDLSYCYGIGAQTLEVIGKKCKMLARLHRHMHPLVYEKKKLSQNDEARALQPQCRNSSSFR